MSMFKPLKATKNINKTSWNKTTKWWNKKRQEKEPVRNLGKEKQNNRRSSLYSISSVRYTFNNLSHTMSCLGCEPKMHGHQRDTQMCMEGRRRPAGRGRTRGKRWDVESCGTWSTNSSHPTHTHLPRLHGQHHLTLTCRMDGNNHYGLWWRWQTLYVTGSTLSRSRLPRMERKHIDTFFLIVFLIIKKIMVPYKSPSLVIRAVGSLVLWS